MLHYHSVNKITSVASAQVREERIGLNLFSIGVEHSEIMQHKVR